jgi:predicted RNA-binding protein
LQDTTGGPSIEIKKMKILFSGQGVIKICEANAYLRKPGEHDELLLEMVDLVYPQEDTLILEDIFGRRKIVKAKISELALVDHKIILEIE